MQKSVLNSYLFFALTVTCFDCASLSFLSLQSLFALSLIIISLAAKNFVSLQRTETSSLSYCLTSKSPHFTVPTFGKFLLPLNCYRRRYIIITRPASQLRRFDNYIRLSSVIVEMRFAITRPSAPGRQHMVAMMTRPRRFLLSGW
jgi:hypothetical protein